MVSLGLIRSPFIGGNGSAFSNIAVLEFLWVCSPQYRHGSFWRQLWFFFRNYRAIKPETSRGIADYMEAAFMDSPPSSGAIYSSKSYYSGVTALCDMFAREYGWSDTETMHKPFGRLFQYVNYIRRKNDKTAPLFNPSDRILGKILHNRNANG